MSSANLLDKKHMVHATVEIRGEELSFVYLTLEQEYGQHHRFEVGLDYDINGQAFMDDPTEQIELIGAPIKIIFKHGSQDAGRPYVFIGVITETRKTGKEGKHGYLVLKGGSPTMMLDRGKRMDIYSDTGLRHIFTKLTDMVPDYCEYCNEPSNKDRIDFLMQYNESDWAFLQRIAYLYGESLFYTGTEIVFGTYREWEPVKLTYDKEIADINFCARMLPNQSVYFEYVADQDTVLQKQTPENIENSNTYLDTVAYRNKLFLTKGKPAKNKLGVSISTRPELDNLVKRDMSRTAAQTIYVTGTAKTYEPIVGRLITICMPEGMSKTKELGTYRIIKSTHTIAEGNRYSNEFEAVPASLQTMPVTEPVMPVVDSMLATVKDTEDPKGQGRVLVEFEFSNQYNWLWMRVMSPSAGSGNEGAKNRGMVFIPEKGDQVMVGFEFGDPNRPYVMGSMFHGNNGAGGGEENNIKSITTRSGHTIEFDDAKDTLGITIKDLKDNIIHINTAKDSILIKSNKDVFVQASENMKFKAKNMHLEVEESLTAKIGKDTTVEIGNDFNLSSQNNAIIEVKNTLTTNVKNSVNKADDIKLLASNGLMLKGNSKAKLQGGKVELQGSSNKLELP